MDVSELIEKLKKFPADTLVCVQDIDPDFKVQLFMDVLEVERITDSHGTVIALLTVEEV